MINNLKHENIIQKQSDSIGALINGNLSCCKADYRRSASLQAADVNDIYIIKSIVSFGKYIVPAAFLSSHSERDANSYSPTCPTNEFLSSSLPYRFFRRRSLSATGERSSLVSRLPGPIPFSGKSITSLKKVGRATP
jgi:hypothetical protein